MNKGMRIVSPFKPFPPESDLHKGLSDFDWHGALRMMAHSARQFCHAHVSTVTDLTSDVPGEALRFQTSENRLMLWTLEAQAAFLGSKWFDRNTVLVDADQLICADLTRYFVAGADLVVLIRSKVKNADEGWQTLLNGMQWWNVRGRDRLAGFYQQALALAKTLPEASLQWGADTEAVRLLLEPLELGMQLRQGLQVCMLESTTVLETFSDSHRLRLAEGRLKWPMRPVLDFRFTRKPYMRPAFEALFVESAREALAC